jgi:methylated-DNA-[protein]-cysteine S-methyltransferase
MYTTYHSPVGELTLVGPAGRLSGVYFPQHWICADRADFGEWTAYGFEAATAQLDEYFAGTRREFDLDTAAEGDEFQRRVWALIAAIPYGATRTYGELAAELGAPRAAREIGAAVGRNPLSIVVACHRVVGKNGVLTGYAGGLQRKRFLLDLEQDQHARLF